MHRCSYCLENFDIFLPLPCPQHNLCDSCLKTVFERAMQNKDNYPATCCNKVAYPIQLIEPYSRLFDGTFAREYAAKEAEYQAEKPVYDKQAFLAQHDVKPCPGCRRPIQLKDAWNHMTCTCGQQFCFFCCCPWPCKYGCPKYGLPDVDELGYTKLMIDHESGVLWPGGYQKDTGFQDGILDRDRFDNHGVNTEKVRRMEAMEYARQVIARLQEQERAAVEARAARDGRIAAAAEEMFFGSQSPDDMEFDADDEDEDDPEVRLADALEPVLGAALDAVGEDVERTVSFMSEFNFYIGIR